MEQNFKKTLVVVAVITIITSSFFGGAVGYWAAVTAGGNNQISGWVKDNVLKNLGISQTAPVQQNNDIVKVVDEESAIISAVDKVSPAVVSIIVTKDLPKIDYYGQTPFDSDFFRQFFGDSFGDFFDFGIPQQGPQGQDQEGTQETEIGGGTGFVISSDGYVVTNKHVVSDESADYTVLMNDEKKYPAEVLARDQINDLAVLKIEAGGLPTVELGDSSNLKVGQSVIAIGNALGEFRNTVSVGVISGLARSIVAGGAGIGSEALAGVIQTDASINPGNSGGPLLNSSGQVIGINTAVAQGAQNIGFAIPINEVKGSIESVKQTGKIVRPWLGIRYIMINQEIAGQNKLPKDYGALVVRGDNRQDLAVIPGSPADKAGIMENDIILEIDGKKIHDDNPLAKAISQKRPGDEITLKVYHRGEEKDIKVKLEKME